MKKEERLHSEFLIHLKEVMEEEHIYLGKLSANTNIDKANLSRIVSGETSPRIGSVANIVDGLGRKLVTVKK
ncbi:MAG: helix-turn-helix transcriptional regulator [Bacteroidota bacterium]